MASNNNNRLKMSATGDPKEHQLQNIDCLRSMARTTLSCLDNLENNQEKLGFLKTLEEVMVGCAVTEHKVIESHRAALEATREVQEEMEAGIQSGSTLSSTKNFLKMYDHVLEEKLCFLEDEEIAANDSEVQVIRQEIQAVIDPGCENKNITLENEDLVATEEEVNLVDPISKKMMTNPVRNKLCGHVYEKASILQMLKQTKRKGFRCPTMGCGNRKPISPSNLEDAVDIMRLIRQQLSEAS